MLISTTAIFPIAFDIFVDFWFNTFNLRTVDVNVDHLSIWEHGSENLSWKTYNNM